MKVNWVNREGARSFDLAEGTCWVGGGLDDSIHVEGLPPRFLELRVDGNRLIFRCPKAIDIDGVFVPPNVPRLVVSGERIALPNGEALEVPEKRGAPTDTAALLKQLISGSAGTEVFRGTAHLTCLTGTDLGRRFVLGASGPVLGRGPEAQIRLRDRAVSREHAKIRKEAAGYSVEDLSTPNGLYLNGVRVRAVHPLKDGDILEAGRSLLRFSVGFAEPAAAPLRRATRSSQIASDRPAARRMDWAFIGMGAALAVAGLIVTWGAMA